jgi:hypothetical protein
MLTSQAHLLPGAAELARLHAAEVPQKDDLCGAFCTSLALRAAGYELDQDDVAVAAGTAISPTGHAESLPPGQKGRRDYRLDVPIEHDEDRSGTAAGGLVRAVPELTGGERTAVPVAGPFTPETVDAVMAVARAEDDAALVLNVGTGKWWGSKPTAAQVVAYLETGDPDIGPDSEWSVGHFVSCWGTVQGRAGTLWVIADTYPALGNGAVHVQPRERVAAALAREGMTPGGVLVIVPSGRSDAVAAALRERGLRVESWDNGSVDVRA